jgi:hypothetical protein
LQVSGQPRLGDGDQLLFAAADDPIGFRKVDLVDNLILQKNAPVADKAGAAAPDQQRAGAKPATVPSLRIARTTRTSSLKVNFGLMFRSPETVADSSPRAVFAPAARARAFSSSRFCSGTSARSLR